MSSYGTRRATQHATPLPIPIMSTSPNPPQPGGSQSFSHSASTTGKARRPSTSSLARRRLSQTGARPSSISSTVSYSVPVSAPALVGPQGGRGRSSSSATFPQFDDEDDGEIQPGTTGKRGQIFSCEKCSKIYKHSSCLTKHRWEHTSHWKEASKLLLSKHQQVQLLEAAAILKAASAGSSLPDQKDFWPAAVSPPSSGLLGSHSLNIDVLTSPRMFPSRSLRPEYDTNPSEVDDEEEEPEEDQEEGEDTSESVSTMGDDNLEKGMFDMEIESTTEIPQDEGPHTMRASKGVISGLARDGTRSGSEEGRDSDYGSLPNGGGNQSNRGIARGAQIAAPALGFFHPSSSPQPHSQQQRQ